MQVSLDLPLAALAGPLTDIVSTLTPEQKMEVAKSVLLSLMTSVEADKEIEEVDKRAIDHVREQRNGRWNNDRIPEEECRKDPRYHEYVAKQSTGPRAKILAAMIGTAADTVKEEVIKAIRESPLVQATIDVVCKHVTENMPHVIQQGITLHIAGVLDRSMSASLSASVMPFGKNPNNGEEIKVLTGAVLSSEVSARVRAGRDALGIQTSHQPPLPYQQ